MSGHRAPGVVRWASAILGVVFALAVIGDGAVTLLDVAARASYTTRTTTYRLPADRALEIDADGSRVSLVRAAPGEGLAVRARVTGGLVSPDVSRAYSGGRLKLRGPCPGVLVISCGVRWRVAVPDGTRLRVTGEADLGADGVRPRGTFVVRAGSGDVDLEGDGLRRLDVETRSGDVHLDLGTAPASLRAVTRAGDVHVEVPDVPYALDAATDSGDRHIEAAEDARATRHITVRTGAGDVHVQARGR